MPHYLISAFTQCPWAITLDKFSILEEIVSRRVAGEKLDPEAVQERIHGAKRPADRRVGSVAVMQLFGTIFPRANLMTQIYGATSAELFGKQFEELVKDPEVNAIVLDVDSPGGQVNGVEELSQKIYQARGRKPVVAVANHLAASAAYWIASAADEVVITPSGEVGSIGVFAAHWDESAALEKEGLKLTLISEGKYKTEGNPYQPLTEEARGALQTRVSEIYDAFTGAVAINRGVSLSTVKNGFGEGRMVNARQAVRLQMADRVGTLDETISRLAGGKLPAKGAGASVLTDEQREQAEFLRERVKAILSRTAGNRPNGSRSTD